MEVAVEEPSASRTLRPLRSDKKNIERVRIVEADSSADHTSEASTIIVRGNERGSWTCFTRVTDGWCARLDPTPSKVSFYLSASETLHE